MKKVHRIRELTEDEVSDLLTDSRFSRLRPEYCKSCGQTEAFSRRIFRITGLSTRERNSERVQNSLRGYFQDVYGIQWVFFRSRP